MPSVSSELLRLDPLTGCKNYLGFLEMLTSESLPRVTNDGLSRELLRVSAVNSSRFSAILFLDMNYIREFNETTSRAFGNSVIRWMGLLLQEESQSEVYRVGGVEFAVLLNLKTREEHSELTGRILRRIEREAGRLGFPVAAADIALIHLDQTPTSLDGLLMILGEAMVHVKNESPSHFLSFNAADFKIHAQAPQRWKLEGPSDISFAIRWISLVNIHQVLELGKMLDETQQEAYTDAISGLPNMKAALINMEETLQDSTTSRRPFSILLIDGDNIRIYNNINYAAGDEMIRELSAVLRANLRPDDFVARWRSGDEFIIILPNTSTESAQMIGERFRMAVKEKSQGWKFPVTISIGIAGYPNHGESVTALVDKAEAANKHAKEQGKDQVVTAD